MSDRDVFDAGENALKNSGQSKVPDTFAFPQSRVARGHFSPMEKPGQQIHLPFKHSAIERFGGALITFLGVLAIVASTMRCIRSGYLDMNAIVGWILGSLFVLLGFISSGFVKHGIVIDVQRQTIEEWTKVAGFRAFRKWHSIRDFDHLAVAGYWVQHSSASARRMFKIFAVHRCHDGAGVEIMSSLRFEEALKEVDRLSQVLGLKVVVDDTD